MKRIIELPDKVVEAIQNGEDYRYDIHTAIAQSTPYNPSGDCISREALKGVIETYRPALIYNNKTDMKNRMVDYFLDEIDNAPTVEPVIKCPDCKFYRKKWFVDRRMKEKGYWNCWCECHDYWVGGENGFCSLAEKKGGAE